MAYCLILTCRPLEQVDVYIIDDDEETVDVTTDEEKQSPRSSERTSPVTPDVEGVGPTTSVSMTETIEVTFIAILFSVSHIVYVYNICPYKLLDAM